MDAQRVTMITLAVADVEKSRAYYRAIGWTEAEGGNDKIAFYKLRGLFLSLYSRESLIEDMGMPIIERATGAITVATNYNSPADVDNAYAIALAAGATAITQPESVFWGGYSGMLADPDGHLWEYAHNPFWSFDGDGYLVGDA